MHTLPKQYAGRLVSLAAALMGAAASVAGAQQPRKDFTIKQGDTTLKLSSVPSAADSDAALVDLTVTRNNMPDHAHRSWWWFRLPGETRETAFHTANPDWTLAGGDTAARMAFALSPNLSATMEWSVSALDGSMGLVQSQVAVTNNGGAAATATLFHYLDLDLGGSRNDDTARFTNPGNAPTLDITDGIWNARYVGDGAGFTAYSSAAFPATRNLLANGAADDFDNKAANFMQGDWAGGFEWTRMIQPGQTSRFRVSMLIGPNVPEPGAVALLASGAAACLLLRARRARRHRGR